MIDACFARTVARVIPAPVVASAAPAVEPARFDPPLVVPVDVADAMPAAISYGPRLERLTLGEVALVTTPVRQPVRPRPAPTPLAMPPAILARAATPVRFSSLAPPLADQQSLRIDGRERVLLVLNAARVQGLAARTRRYLAAHGVREALVGDAPRVRERSVIIAPPSQWARAKALARSLKFAPRTIRGTRLMLVLGALLHDFGHINADYALFSKFENLDETTRLLYKRHPADGLAIARGRADVLSGNQHLAGHDRNQSFSKGSGGCGN